MDLLNQFDLNWRPHYLLCKSSNDSSAAYMPVILALTNVAPVCCAKAELRRGPVKLKYYAITEFNYNSINAFQTA